MRISADFMISIWTGAIIMGLSYCAGMAFWGWSGSYPFVIGQVVFGVLGLLREQTIKAGF